MTNPSDVSVATTGGVETSAPSAPRRRVGRIIGRTVFGVVAGVIVLAMIAMGVVAFTIQRSFPQLDGEVALAGLDGRVTVQRDDLGIPVITATTTHDLFFAQGFVHAQDRFWEMDFRRHLTAGRLSELFGASQLGTDRFLRTLGWHRIAEEEVAALDPEVRSYYEDYAAGVNAWLAGHQGGDASLEYAVLGLQNADYEIEPWTATDSVAWLKAMAWDLRGNIGDEIDRALLAQDYTADEIAQLYPRYPFDEHPVIVRDAQVNGAAETARTARTAAADPGGEVGTVPWDEVDAVPWGEVGSIVDAAGALLGDVGEGIGSNSWVVSGRYTESGLPLLSNDPHLGASLPSVWHQVGLRCAQVTDACPFDVTGFGFSGVPGVIIGHNQHIAWGFTNLTTDVTDLYIEKVDGDQYWRDGALVDVETRTETIKVAGGDDVELEIRSTVHGPLLTGLTTDYEAIAADPVVGAGVDATLGAPIDTLPGEYEVALRWTALEVGNTAASIFALDRARTWDEFRAAAALFDVPAQNLVYADVEGNIGYQTPGRLPIRGAGNGTVPQPGWDSSYDWTGYIPFEELPTAFNPPAGYIVTANNAIVDDSYAYFLSEDWDYGFRAQRIVELIERAIAHGTVSADHMRAIQNDDQFWMGKRLAAVIRDDGVAALVDDKTAEALELLEMWDAQNSADSAAAAYANVLWRNLVHEVFAAQDPAIPLSSQSRLFVVVDALLDDPDSPWWTHADAGVTGRDEMIAHAAELATAELVAVQGDQPARWSWGDLHAITLTNESFGSAGIGVMDWLFNRGPYPVAGGSSVVNANGWVLDGDGYATVTVPSMRMIVDLADLDASTWNHLTGASGHAFHPNYTDQFETWQTGDTTPWAFSREAVDAAATHTLTLVPARD